MPQSKPRFLGLKQEFLRRRQPVSCARVETERSQQHHYSLSNSPYHKLQFSMSEPRSPFSTGEKGNGNKAPDFNGTLSKLQILLLHSPSLHQKISQPTQILQYECVPSKNEVVQQCGNGATTHSPNSSISSKKAIVVSGSEQASPGCLHHDVGSKDTQSCRKQSGSVFIAGLRQMLRYWNNLRFPTYKSIYEDFSSFFTLMESINISQLLQQVDHSYGNMCWVLRTTNREANTFSINNRWLLGQCVHDTTPKQLAIQYLWGDTMHCNHSSRAQDTRHKSRLLQQTFLTSTKIRELLCLLYQAILLFLHGSYLFISNQTCWSWSNEAPSCIVKTEHKQREMSYNNVIWVFCSQW